MTKPQQRDAFFQPDSNGRGIEIVQFGQRMRHSGLDSSRSIPVMKAVKRKTDK